MNSIINTLGGIVRLCFSIITIPVLIRILGISHFGEYALLTAVINLFSLAEWSIAMAVTVFLAKAISTPFSIDKEYKRVISSTFVLLLFTIIVISCFFSFGSKAISTVITTNHQISEHFKALGLTIAINLSLRSLQQFFIGLEQAHQFYKLSNLIATAYSLSIAIATIISAYYLHDIAEIVISQSVITGIFILIHYFVCLNRKVVNLFCFSEFSFTHLRPIATFTFKTWLAAFGGLLFLQGDKILINRILGLEVTGIYAALTSIVAQINVISALPVQPIVPLVAAFIMNGRSKHESSVLLPALKRSFALNSTIAVVLGVTILFFSPEIILLLDIGKSFSNYQVILFLKIITGVYCLYSLNATGYYCLYASGKEKYIAGITLFSSLFTLALIAALSFWLGPVGAFIGNAGFACTLIFLKKSSSVLNIEFTKLFSGSLLITLILPLAFFIVSFDLSILIRISVYLLLLGGSLAWLINRVDALSLFTRIYRVR